MVIELKIVTDIIITLPNGKLKVLSKNARITRAFESTNITYQTYLDKKGRPVKKYTTLIYGNEYLQADHPIDEVKRLIGHYEIKGYAGKAKYARNNKNKGI